MQKADAIQKIEACKTTRELSRIVDAYLKGIGEMSRGTYEEMAQRFDGRNEEAFHVMCAADEKWDEIEYGNE